MPSDQSKILLVKVFIPVITFETRIGHALAVSRLSTEPAAPFTMATAPSTLFTGREAYLELLMACFFATAKDIRIIALLWGMGGIGKTQICLKFLQMVREK